MLRNMTSIYLTKGEKMLLLYRQGGRVVNNVWVGSAGGHFEQEELNDPKACALRELREEIGLTAEDLLDLQLRYVCLRHVNGEIRQNYYFFAQLQDSVPEALTSCEGRLQWFSLNQVQSMDMPYSAKAMMEHYLAEGRYNEKLYTGTADGRSLVFTELAAY